MATSAKDAEDAEALGLVAHSYDSLFSIRKRMRKINDITIPLRRGLGTDQVGAAILTFIACVITFGIIVRPLVTLIGYEPGWRFILAWLIIPPLLVGQRIAKPMGYGKSIGGTVTSWMRYHLDDRIHRRGLPIKTPPLPPDEKRIHYQREWVIFDDYTNTVSGETDLSDPDTDRRFTNPEPLNLPQWMDDNARTNLAAARERRAAADHEKDTHVHFRRSTDGTVHTPDDEETA